MQCLIFQARVRLFNIFSSSIYFPVFKKKQIYFYLIYVLHARVSLCVFAITWTPSCPSPSDQSQLLQKVSLTFPYVSPSPQTRFPPRQALVMPKGRGGSRFCIWKGGAVLLRLQGMVQDWGTRTHRQAVDGDCPLHCRVCVPALCNDRTLPHPPRHLLPPAIMTAKERPTSQNGGTGL